MSMKSLLTILIIVVVLTLSILILSNKPPETPVDVAKCIGENSILYVKLGCHACETQEEMFGDNYDALNVIDCFYERNKCVDAEISATPTWIIEGRSSRGVQSIEELKILTGCQ